MSNVVSAIQVANRISMTILRQRFLFCYRHSPLMGAAHVDITAPRLQKSPKYNKSKTLHEYLREAK